MRIKRIDNGAEVTFNKWEGGDNEAPYTKAYIWDTVAQDYDGVINMLYEIAEGLGEYGNKHDKMRLEIHIVHGSKYECKDKKCDICAGEYK